MLADFQDPPAPGWQQWQRWSRWLRAGVILLLTGAAYLLWRYQPVPRDLETSAAYLCRQDYARARAPADTLAIDARIWELSRRPWARVPSCGELRMAGKL